MTGLSRLVAAHLGLCLLSLLALLFFVRYTLPTPYYLDTFGYVVWIQTYSEKGYFPSLYRLMDTYLYFYPVKLFGELGIKITTMVVITVFTGCYYRLIQRDFSTPIAIMATLILLSSPTTIISVTHLKEDYTALLFLALAMLIGGKKSIVHSSLAGVAYGLSLLFKEATLAAFPCVLAYVYLAWHPDRTDISALWRDTRVRRAGLALLVFLAGVCFIHFAIAPERYKDFFLMAGSPHTGQFLGFFSKVQRRGYQFWQEAILYLSPWYGVCLVSLGAAVWRRDAKRCLYFVAFVILFGVLSNTSVIRARHYAPALFFLAPLCVDGVLLLGRAVLKLLARRGLPSFGERQLAVACLLGVTSLCGLQIAYVVPTLEYRLRYHPLKEYYGLLRSHLPADAMLLGMDNCLIASYFSRLPCIKHPVDPDQAAYAHFKHTVGDALATHPVFLIPDFFSYDASGVLKRRFAEDFQLKQVFSGLSEDYHAMTYGPSARRVIAQILRGFPACRYVNEDHRDVAVSPQLTLLSVTYRFACGADMLAEHFWVYKGHVTFLRQQSIYQVQARS